MFFFKIQLLFVKKIYKVSYEIGKCGAYRNQWYVIKKQLLLVFTRIGPKILLKKKKNGVSSIG